jgi:hypothetical protein
MQESLSAKLPMPKPYNSRPKMLFAKQRGFIALPSERPLFAHNGINPAVAQFTIGRRTSLTKLNLENRNGTRYLMFDEAVTIADVFAQHLA